MVNKSGCVFEAHYFILLLLELRCLGWSFQKSPSFASTLNLLRAHFLLNHGHVLLFHYGHELVCEDEATGESHPTFNSAFFFFFSLLLNLFFDFRDRPNDTSRTWLATSLNSGSF